MRQVTISFAQFERLPHLLHLADFTIIRSPNALHFGQMVWEAKLDGNRVGIAWEWTELQPSVVIIMDPMNVRSNIRIQGIDGEVLDSERTLVYLNGVVFSLAWQSHIRVKTMH